MNQDRDATVRIPNTMQSVLDYLLTKNVYTADHWASPLTIRALRGLETAGAGVRRPHDCVPS
jgi:hypothetical protein